MDLPVLVGELLATLVAVVEERGVGLLLRQALGPHVDLDVRVVLVLVDRREVALVALVGHVPRVKPVIKVSNLMNSSQIFLFESSKICV